MDPQKRQLLTVDYSPSILAPTNLLSLNDDGLLGSNNSKWNDVLDLSVERTLLFVQFVIIVRVHLEIVEGEFLLDPLLESRALLKGKRV
jgi:hypothetical protein